MTASKRPESAARIGPAIPRSLKHACRTALAYARSRHGGGMLILCGFALTVMAGVGAAMTNYAWKEAQWERLQASLRAAVSSAGPLLAGAGGAMDEAIRERVSRFLQGSLPGLEVSPDDVTVEHDPATNVTAVGITGVYGFRDIWEFGQARGGDADGGEAIGATANVRYEADRYEVGIALDISSSMSLAMPDGDGGSVVKIDALKNALAAVLDTVGEVSATDPGSVMASIVPFGSAVNVADTCNPDAATGRCRAARSAGKERYLRLLAGPRETMAETLAAARSSGGQWVDAYHHYGAAEGLGPLAAMSLPQDLLDNRDWNLRRTDVEIDVRAQAPNLDTGAARGSGYWQVHDEDFWNGCVMARWGNYRDPAAREPGWTVDGPDNWPAATDVPAWGGGAQALDGVPLHISDAPPDAADPKTLFTAYSWPDARIGGNTDHRLLSVMLDLLGDVGGSPFNPVTIGHLRENLTQTDNDWSVRWDRGGANQCPTNAVTPLTDDLEILRSAVAGLDPVRQHGHAGDIRFAVSGTYLGLGIVWGLRTVSPLWRETWAVTDIGASPRPGTPCAPGAPAVDCDARLQKSVLIVSDGTNDPGIAGWRLLPSTGDGHNPVFTRAPFRVQCRLPSMLPNYKAAMAESGESEFNRHFSAFVDAGGRFTAAGAAEAADRFHRYLDADFDPLNPEMPDPNPSRNAARAGALEGLTPWQVFRGVGGAEGIAAITDPSNRFGFDGRPLQMGHLCRRSSLFGPYGRLDDSLRAGESGGLNSTLLPPVEGASPFSGDFANANDSEIALALKSRLDDWFYEACRVAGLRRVRVNAIFIGEDSALEGIENLRQCVRLAGGDADRDVYVTPTAAALRDTLVEIFSIQRNLRFVD